MLPILRLFAEGAPNVAACLPALQKQFNISDEEAAQLIPSGRNTTILQSRAHWARTYLSKAGLLVSPRRNLHVITELGRQVLASNPERIDNETLSQFPGFTEWIEQSRQAEHSGRSAERPVRAKVSVDITPIDERQTPLDAMEAASALLDAALRDELISLLYQLSPQRFERVILDLLLAMGYGGGDLANGLMTKATGDGGIDGIIHEDALGLDAVYVQAKRYAADNKVSRPDVQRFIGSLTGEGATKGVFVTTSDSSKEAHEYLHRVQHRVVLINGQRLAQLMIQHGVGVRVRQTYKVQSVDEDYFGDALG